MKLLSSIIAILVWLGCPGSIIGQERFNIRQDLDQNALVYTGVIESSEGFHVTGNCLNPTDTGVYQSIFWAKISTSGVLSELRNYNLTEGHFLFNYNIGMKTLNDEFSQSNIGYQQSLTNSNQGFVINYSTAGDTTVIRFPSPYLENINSQFIAPVQFCNSSNDDNSIFISSNILNTESGTGGDFYIQRMKPDGEVLWEYIYATDAQPEYCNALLPTENGGGWGF